MKPQIFIFWLLMFCTNLIAQEQYFEKLDSNLTKVYFSAFGNVASIAHYEFYRIGKLNSDFKTFNGEIEDYNSFKKKIFESQMVNGQLQGKGVFYYGNGNIYAEGYYKDNKRDSIWTVYYPNGRLKMKIRYNDYVYLLEYNNLAGKKIVINGNGQIKWNCTSLIANVKGEVKNGLRIGIWKNYDFYEMYDDSGSFIYGIDQSKERYNETVFEYLYPLANEFASIKPVKTIKVGDKEIILP